MSIYNLNSEIFPVVQKLYLARLDLGLKTGTGGHNREKDELNIIFGFRVRMLQINKSVHSL